MKRKQKIRKNKLIRQLGIIFTLICLLFLSLLSYFLFKLDIVPIKYLLVSYGIFVLVILFLILTIFGRGSRSVKVISLFIMTLLSFVFGLASYYLNNTYQFLSNTFSRYDTLNYSVLVLNNSSYNDITSLNNKNISYLDDKYKIDIKNNLTSKVNYKENLVLDFSVISDLLINKKTDAIVLEEGYLNLIYEEDDSYKDKTKVIYTFEVKVESHKEISNVSVTEQPFVLYISGIDQYGNVTSVRGRSDVNILAVINPITNKILLVNTPRDYYVRLAGTTGLKDKLTHAGIYGIDKSINTLENIYGIDINHYLRVNFNTLIKVVDVIGGIDIYSDKAFRPWTNGNIYINHGWNHMDGKTALAYARERHAYINGDHHRGANQQQVITAIINKVSKSSVLISKYNSILNALNGSFQTDIDTSIITSFIRYQLDKMPNWNIESIAVTGYNSYNYTYSMGTGYKLYVMEPDYDSVEVAKNRIKEVLNGK